MEKNLTHQLNVGREELNHANNEEFDGTGAGLATVQGILNRHNGRIWVDVN